MLVEFIPKEKCSIMTIDKNLSFKNHVEAIAYTPNHTYELLALVTTTEFKFPNGPYCIIVKRFTDQNPVG